MLREDVAKAVDTCGIVIVNDALLLLASGCIIGLAGGFTPAAHTGRPLADDRWLAKAEARLGRRLRPHSPGRPKRPHRKPAKWHRQRARIGNCP